MSLERFLAEGRLRRHKTSAKEIAELLRVVQRDLADASIVQLSADRRFATAYNAALQLATIALRAVGYRAAGGGHHWTTFNVLPEIMGPEAQSRAGYLDNCRTKRNVTDYDRAGEVSDIELDELLNEVLAFRTDLLAWLRLNHPGLLTREAK